MELKLTELSVCLFVCLFVCLCVCPLSSVESHTAELHQIFMHVFCGRGSILVWRRCDTLCTSGFTDDAMFSYHGANGRIRRDVMFRRVRQVAVPVGCHTASG